MILQWRQCGQSTTVITGASSQEIEERLQQISDLLIIDVEEADD
jgi:hypothetical protein